jgi:3-methylfumaryl-CoA hydratase
MAKLMEAADYADWVGRQQRVDDTVSLGAARRMAALLDQHGAALKTGDAVPAHWYAMACTPFDSQSALQIDGHPRKGEFLPPVPLPRRSMGGRRVSFHQPLRIGEEIERRSTIVSITPKNGRSGKLCIVTVRHDYVAGNDGLRVTDEQDIIYREEASGEAPKQAAAEPAISSIASDAQSAYLPDTLLLFRFSAITFNAHRVHYDAAYAREVEHYPALVVNGSLTSLKLWDFATRQSGRVLTASRSRNLRPLFVNAPVSLHLANTGPTSASAWAVNAQGELAVQADLEFASGRAA